MKRDLSIILTFLMCVCLLGVNIFADESIGSQGNPVTNNDQLKEAISAIPEGESGTIYLGEGSFSIYDENVKSTYDYKEINSKPVEKPIALNKTITFIGSGTDKTTWTIVGAENPQGIDSADCSFANAESIIFKNLKLVSNSNSSHSGFTAVKNITLEDAIFEGQAGYWGVESTTFRNVEFISSSTSTYPIYIQNGRTTDYYVGGLSFHDSTYSFINCTFNCNNRFIKAWDTNNTSTNKEVTINIENCAFNYAEGVTSGKYPVELDDANYASGNEINFKGTNTFNGKSDVKLINKDGSTEKTTISYKSAVIDGTKTSVDVGDITYKDQTQVTPTSQITLVQKVEVLDDGDKETSKASKKLDEDVKTKAEKIVEDKLQNKEIKLNDSTETISSDNHEVDGYTFLDVELTAKVGEQEYSVSKLKQAVQISLTLDDEKYNEVKDADLIKVLRIHVNSEGQEESELLDASLSDDKVITFATDRFSTYAIVTFNKKVTSETKADTSVSPSVKKAGDKDLNSDGVVTCDEEMNDKNWVWSEAKKTCVYKVSNTKTR